MKRVDSAASSNGMAGFDDFGEAEMIYKPKVTPNKFQD